MDDKKLTYGQKAVGLTFNPGGEDKVSEVKALYAKIIDLCKEMLDNEPTYAEAGDTEMRIYSEKGQILLNAIREAQGAQMWAVKGITFK